MNVTVRYPNTRPINAPGPGDLNTVGTDATIVVDGPPTPRDYGLWTGAIGSAVLRGASVTRA